MPINIGILIFGDPTRGGTITSEVKFLTNLYETHSLSSEHQYEFFIITVNPSVTKRVIREASTTYKFPHKIVACFTESDYHKLDNLSCIVTYPGHSNFFGGYLNDNIVTTYKIISKCTNVLKIPVFVRVNDSEIKVRDYRKMSEVRLIDGESKPESAFMKDPGNVAKARDLVSWKEWDYNLVYWFANGSREACDWVAETLFDREDETYRMAPRQTFVDHTIYVSDDIFFLIRKNYERFQHLIDNSPSNERLCYIGFFDTVNVARAKALNILFKENSHRVPVKIFGKGTEVLTKFKGKDNIDIEEGFIKGDSDEYFDFLNSHLAYIFIGKGQSRSRYIGKTVYDAIVARSPILVYGKCDEGHITFTSDEFYFRDERELHEKFEALKDPETRQRWLIEQSDEIFRKLPPSEFRFENYCKEKPELPENVIHVQEIPIKPVKEKKEKIALQKEQSIHKSIELF